MIEQASVTFTFTFLASFFASSVEMKSLWDLQPAFEHGEQRMFIFNSSAGVIGQTCWKEKACLSNGDKTSAERKQAAGLTCFYKGLPIITTAFVCLPVVFATDS